MACHSNASIYNLKYNTARSFAKILTAAFDDETTFNCFYWANSLAIKIKDIFLAAQRDIYGTRKRTNEWMKYEFELNWMQ